MSWKQHLVLAVMAVLALAVTAYAQPTVTSVSVAPVPKNVVISPNVNSFSLYVYANVSNYSTSYTYSITVNWLGTNYTISSISVSQIGGTTTYQLSGSTTLPTPSKPGTYTGTVYVVIRNSTGVVNYAKTSFTVNAYPMDIINYTWFTVPGVGYQCILPNSTFEFELLVYIKPVPATGYLWSNATFLGTKGSNTVQTTPNVTGVEWIYSFRAPSTPGTYSGTAFFGNYSATYSVPWAVTVVSNCSTTTTPAPAPAPPKSIHGIWINSISVSPNPVYVVVGQGNFTVSLTINYVANMTGLINVGVKFMNRTFTGALNVSNGYWSFGDPAVTVPLTLPAPASAGTYTATITATSPNSTASTTLTVIAVSQSQVPSTAVLIKNITITPNPVVGAPNQTVTANATVYFYSVPQTTKVTVVVSLGNYSYSVTLTVPANTTKITTPVTIRLPQRTGNYTGFATAIGQYNSASTRFTALVVTSLSILLSPQYLPLVLIVLLLIIVLVALALRKRQVEIRI